MAQPAMGSSKFCVTQGVGRSVRIQHADAKQIELGAAVHASLQQLEPVDPPLDLAVAPGHDDSSAYRVVVDRQSGSEPPQLGHGARAKPRQPMLVHLAVTVFGQQAQEFLPEPGRCGNTGGELAQRGDEGLPERPRAVVVIPALACVSAPIQIAVGANSKYLKVVGVSSQREIEWAVHEALAAGNVSANARLSVRMTLELPDLQLASRFEGEIDLG